MADASPKNRVEFEVTPEMIEAATEILLSELARDPRGAVDADHRDGQVSLIGEFNLAAVVERALPRLARLGWIREPSERKRL